MRRSGAIDCSAGKATDTGGHGGAGGSAACSPLATARWRAGGVAAGRARRARQPTPAGTVGPVAARPARPWRRRAGGPAGAEIESPAQPSSKQPNVESAVRHTQQQCRIICMGNSGEPAEIESPAQPSSKQPNVESAVRHTQQQCRIICMGHPMTPTTWVEVRDTGPGRNVALSRRLSGMISIGPSVFVHPMTPTTWVEVRDTGPGRNVALSRRLSGMISIGRATAHFALHGFGLNPGRGLPRNWVVTGPSRPRRGAAGCSSDGPFCPTRVWSKPRARLAPKLGGDWALSPTTWRRRRQRAGHRGGWGVPEV